MNTENDRPRDEIGSLIAGAGPPPEIPPADLAAIRGAARRQWRESTAARGLSSAPIFEGRLRPLLALAALLALAVVSLFIYRSTQSPAIVATTVATVELSQGDVRLGTGEGLSSSAEVTAGSRIDTFSSATQVARVALRLNSGHSVRLDEDSSLIVGPEGRLELRRGAVYVDSGPAGIFDSLEIVTPVGSVSEVGTQYEVRDAGDSIRVRVREGSVSLTAEADTHFARRGEELTVATNGAVGRREIDLYGPEWAWVAAIAPSLDVEGRTLGSFLEWVARETGLQVEFEDAEVERTSAAELVHGDISGMVPEDALKWVLRASGLVYRIEAGTLLVRAAPVS